MKLFILLIRLYFIYGSFGLFHSDMKLSKESFLIGTGIADITGPAAEVNMMGYAKLSQDSGGIHFRLYSRAFIFEDLNGKRICFVSADLGMIDQAIKTQVVQTLKSKYNDVYNEKNLMISGTHTHSGPGGFLQYVLYIITAQGFNWQSFNVIVEGIVRSISRAHENICSGFIFYNKGMLLNASINRSPTAYANNSEAEKKQYKYDTDKTMHVLKLVDINHEPLGIISWFAVHPTSMNNSNSLISGDNKGVASLLFEKYMNNGSLPGRGTFVAAFANANLGDVSPNIRGPHCITTGLSCSMTTSTCDGKNSNCIAFGPGKDMFESTKIIGERQFLKAKELFEGASEKIVGDVDFIHQHVDMSKFEFELSNGQKVSTCKPAMGYSFAAGTIDGPGAFDFKQGSTTPNRFWNLIRDFISKPSQEMIDCHKPKPILLSTGQMNFPYQWQPTILPTQVFKLGNVLIAGLPAEFTTMAGRRIKAAIKNVFLENSDRNNDIKIFKPHVIISGLSNAYSSYVSTFEEYQVQRYEGASTIFGPHTLDAYIHQYINLTENLIKQKAVQPGPDPPNLLSKQISFRPGVIYDSSPFGTNFGDCLLQTEKEYKIGSIVEVKFVSGHPRNDLMNEKSYLTVEKVQDDDENNCEIIATDTSLETKFIWKRTNSFLGYSEVTIIWEIPEETKPGSYIIRHYGAHKNFLQQIKSYSGQTNIFKVVA